MTIGFNQVGSATSRWRSFSSLLKTLMHRKQRLDSRRWINSLNEMQDQRPDGRQNQSSRRAAL